MIFSDSLLYDLMHLIHERKKVAVKLASEDFLFMLEVKTHLSHYKAVTRATLASGLHAGSLSVPCPVCC